jgi:hypothetical protein
MEGSRRKLKLLEDRCARFECYKTSVKVQMIHVRVVVLVKGTVVVVAVVVVVSALDIHM